MFRELYLHHERTIFNLFGICSFRRSFDFFSHEIDERFTNSKHHWMPVVYRLWNKYSIHSCSSNQCRHCLHQLVLFIVQNGEQARLNKKLIILVVPNHYYAKIVCSSLTIGITRLLW